MNNLRCCYLTLRRAASNSASFSAAYKTNYSNFNFIILLEQIHEQRQGIRLGCANGIETKERQIKDCWNWGSESGQTQQQATTVESIDPTTAYKHTACKYSADGHQRQPQESRG